MEAEHERKTKRTVSLSAEASRRLDVQALGMGLTISAVVEWLVVAWCGDYELKSRNRPLEGRSEESVCIKK